MNIFTSDFDSLYYDSKTREDNESGRKTIKSGNRVSYEYARKAVELYCKCISCGSSVLTKSLPKLLTLWFTFTELTDGNSESSDSLKKSQNLLCDLVEKLIHKKSSTAWYVCIGQLVSRTGHSNSRTLLLTKDIIQRTLENFPRQTIWQIAGLLHSGDENRKLAGKKIVQNAVNSLQRRGDSVEDVKMLIQAESLFSSLIELSVYRPTEKNQKTLVWAAAKTFSGSNLARFIVPSQSALSIRLPTAQPSNLLSATFATDLEFIDSFSSNVVVLSSKARPKIIEVTTSHGNLVKVRHNSLTVVNRFSRLASFWSSMKGMVISEKMPD